MITLILGFFGLVFAMTAGQGNELEHGEGELDLRDAAYEQDGSIIFKRIKRSDGDGRGKKSHRGRDRHRPRPRPSPPPPTTIRSTVRIDNTGSPRLPTQQSGDPTQATGAGRMTNVQHVVTTAPIQVISSTSTSKSPSTISGNVTLNPMPENATQVKVGSPSISSVNGMDLNMTMIMAGSGAFLGVILLLLAIFLFIWQRKGQVKTNSTTKQMPKLAEKMNINAIGRGYSSHIESEWYDIPYQPPSVNSSSNSYADMDPKKIKGNMHPMWKDHEYPRVQQVPPSMNSELLKSVRAKNEAPNERELKGSSRYQSRVNQYDHVYTDMK